MNYEEKHQEISSILNKYLPQGSVNTCADWIIKYNVHLKITKSRATKFGDYMPLSSGIRHHHITINHDLNKYAFLITLVHEFAHLYTFLNFRQQVMPHGLEWKNSFRLLMTPFFEVFPASLKSALESYLNNPAASSCSDTHLMAALRKYDQTPRLLLESLDEGSQFKLDGSLKTAIFKKGKRLRKHFECIDLVSGKKYRIHPLAEIKKLEKN